MHDFFGLHQLTGLFGLLVFLFLAWCLSENRFRMNFRLIASGMGIQLLLGGVLLSTRLGHVIYSKCGEFIQLLIYCSDQGSAFLFTEEMVQKMPGLSFLPVIVFTSSLASILYYLGVLQWLVRLLARVMVHVMDVSGAESLVASANIFVGMTEAPLLTRPFLKTMTRSEIMAMMTSGMATIAGGIMAAYATFVASVGVDPGHLLIASLISAPASLVVAKIMVPETETSPTRGEVKVQVPSQGINLLDAACRGAADGLKLALNVAAMLIAFIGLIALVNWFLVQIPVEWLGGITGGTPLTLQRMLGWVFAPLAWLMGVPWSECQLVGEFLGEKTVLNEFIAYLDLAERGTDLSPRTKIITTYALCGFANFGSVAILIGGISTIVPERRKDLARFGLRSLVGGTLAALMTATVAGMFLAPGSPIFEKGQEAFHQETLTMSRMDAGPPRTNSFTKRKNSLDEEQAGHHAHVSPYDAETALLVECASIRSRKASRAFDCRNRRRCQWENRRVPCGIRDGAHFSFRAPPVVVR
jgi:CNT family concentrative nucleoside transporter